MYSKYVNAHVRRAATRLCQNINTIIEMEKSLRSRRSLVGSVAYEKKAKVRAPGQTSKYNTKSISSVISSQLISGKYSECK